MQVLIFFSAVETPSQLSVPDTYYYSINMLLSPYNKVFLVRIYQVLTALTHYNKLF